jgi:hypothetical protein
MTPARTLLRTAALAAAFAPSLAWSAPPLRNDAAAARATADLPPAPPRRGTGWLVAGSLFAGLGLAANATRIHLARGLCTGVGVDVARAEVTGGDECFASTTSLVMLGPSAAALNVAAFGMLAGGGSARGRWTAHRDALAGRRRVAGPGVEVGVGAVLMLAGAVGYAVARVSSYGDALGLETCSARHPLDPTDAASAQTLAQCVRDRYVGYLAAISATQSASVFGVGLLAHGASHLRRSRLLGDLERRQVRLSPNLSPTSFGLSLVGRF